MKFTPSFILAITALVAFAAAGAGQGNQTNQTNQTGQTGTTGTQPVSLWVEGHDDAAANAYWFTVNNGTERNPTITVPPGAQVRAHFVNRGTMVHNLHFGPPVSAQTDILEAGKSAMLNFTAPTQTGEYAYWCDPHKTLGMQGKFVVGTTTAGGNNNTGGTQPTQEVGENGGTPFPGPVAALAVTGLAAVLLHRRRRRAT